MKKLPRFRYLFAAFFLLTALDARAHYDPSIGCWASRDPVGEKYSPNLHGFCRNAPIIRIDVLGLYDPTAVPNTETTFDIRIPPDTGGVTAFDPDRTYIRVTRVANVLGLKSCYCRLVDAEYEYQIKITFGFSATQQTFQHEGLHAYTDSQLATTALPYAISYLKSLRVSGKPTLEACRLYFQGQADAAVSKVIDLSNDPLAGIVHGYIGVTGHTSAGESQFLAYLPQWLGTTFPVPPQKF